MENMSLLNEACSLQFHTAQSDPDTSVSTPKTHGGLPQAVLSAPDGELTCGLDRQKEMPSYPPLPPSPNPFLIMSVPLGPKGQAVCGTHLSREVKVGGRIKGVTQNSWSTASVTAINLDKMVVIQNRSCHFGSS